MNTRNAPSPDEHTRLAALASYDLLDTPPEREFDDLARLASAALSVESAAVSLIDENRQWFKARVGIPFRQTAREFAFCAHAVTSRDFVVVPDARLDDRFAGNPLVTAPGGIRFYAGAPLILPSGDCLGTLCVFDPAPRQGLTSEHRETLRLLAALAVDLIVTRRDRRMGEIAARAVEASPDAVLATDASGALLYGNTAAHRLFERPAPSLSGLSLDALLSPEAGGASLADFVAARAEIPDGPPDVLLGRSLDGSLFPVEVSAAPWRDADGGDGLVLIVRDLRGRRELEKEREHARTFLNSVISHLPAMLFVKDAETRKYVLINQAGETIMGRPAAEILGRSDGDLFPAYGQDFERRDREAVSLSGPHVFESTFAREDGVTARLRTTRTVIDGPDRPGQYILGITEDMTPTRSAEAEAVRLARHDGLTGLLNRAEAADRLHELVGQTADFALLSVNLGRFKTVNEQWGLGAGDAVLVQAADRLRSLVGPSDWVARVGGDEFALMIAGVDATDRAGDIASKTALMLSDPYATAWGVAHLQAAVGGVIYPRDGQTAERLREHADLALHRARSAKGGACFFHAKMDAEARDRRTLEGDLREAILARRIGLAYQPVVAAGTGRVTSAEALARWTHPVRGPIRPDVFIPLAEEAGLIDLLGAHLLREACLEAQTWPSAVRVAVNLSPLQFSSDRIVETVREALTASGLAPHRLQLEVTEGLLIQDVERTFLQLEALRALGIQVLMDDFGVGYSSLSYFQRFPFDKVKIDKSFVDDVVTSQTARAIIAAVVGLGQALGMGVVAEGVESDEQRRVLAQMGCTHLQGYLFSPPLPPAALRNLLAVKSPVARKRGARAA